MKSGRNFLFVIVTAPNLSTGRILAKAALEKRLIACANLVPKLESHYWWRGGIESSQEVLLLLKTTRPQLARLEAFILSVHPYDTPEIIALPIWCGTERYLKWIQDSVHPAGKSGKAKPTRRKPRLARRKPRS